ncbi:hypothetical protein [Piscibacillus halophilus]|nr:hypothetical protein [Piscibacillus halophilus]
MVWHTENEHLEHIQLNNQQQTIQNLIETSLHEFYYSLDTLDIQYDEQSINFEYETGVATIYYSLNDEHTLKLKVTIQLSEEPNQIFEHHTHWNV